MRGAQLAQIFPILDEATHALLMGDFNFCASWPEENARLPTSYTDLWPALNPHDPGYTEDTAINRMRLARAGKAKQVRFDRVLLRSQPPGWTPTAICLLGTTALGDAEPAVFPSDHFGLAAALQWQNG